jgi:hypothetical protein
LKKREMSTSLEFKDLILVGTYVDTIFFFSANGTFENLFRLRTRESVISMGIVSEEHNIIAIGCANGIVDFIKIEYSEGKPSAYLIQGVMNKEIGYINQIVKS